MTPIARACLAVVAFALVVVVVPARAADVTVAVESSRVDVGIPFQFQIQLDGVTDYESPPFPDTPGVRALGAPGASSQRTLLNGRITVDRVVLTYSLVASVEGPFEIPPIEFVADGETVRTPLVSMMARKPDGGDMLDVEIVPSRASIYLGEAVELTLRIWVKPYVDRQYDVTVQPAGMWGRLDLGRSAWGDFTDAVSDLARGLGRRRVPTSRTVERAPDERGPGGTYYVYEFTTRVWPARVGPLTVSPVSVLLSYPERLRRSRDIFSRGELEVAEAKRVVATASAADVVVLPLPDEGRPPDFTGAVGRFEMTVTAKPTETAVGDPITIRMSIRDRSPVAARLDQLPPPALHLQPDLTADFKVPSDPLAGVVTGRTKVFNQTIRARHDGVAEIPALRFAYFDPDAGTYAVAESDPIPVTVAAVETVSMADVVASGPVGARDATELTAVAGGLLANVTAADALLADRRVVLGWSQAVTTLAPPLLFAAFAIGRRRIRRLRHDRAFVRRKSARATALRAVAEARALGGIAAADRIAAAVRDYVADRCNAPHGAATRGEVVAQLERLGAAPDVRAEVEALLVACEAAQFAGAAAAADDGLADRADDIIQRLERERLR